MANEIDLYQDLEYCEKVLRRKDIDEESRREWEKEKTRVINEIKELYPELIL